MINLYTDISYQNLYAQLLKQLIEQVLDSFSEPETDSEADFSSIKVGIIGRPNVGKSTLVNRLLGEERVVVYDQPLTKHREFRHTLGHEILTITQMLTDITGKRLS